jgi:hypothetical protein
MPIASAIRGRVSAHEAQGSPDGERLACSQVHDEASGAHSDDGLDIQVNPKMIAQTASLI